MRCLRCSTENSEGRKFCKECGSLIANLCKRCGFPNSLIDKYCGGCGDNLVDLNTSGSKEDISSQRPMRVSEKYSPDDINELTEGRTKTENKKEIKKSDEVSQSMIDSIFNSDDNKTDEKEK
ncbi:MAG: zinc ribbon domain-containing protein [Nitrospirae bacterium]|nr:zinc ribbon domain-containing protein [Nitrospirota bacterium]